MALRKPAALLAATLALSAASVVGITGTASAAPATPAHTALTLQQAKAILDRDLRNHTVLSPSQVHSAGVHPDLSCALGYVCGQGANGNSFAYSQCNHTYTLPNLIGNGPLNNNQTGHAVAYFFESSGLFLFSSQAPDYETVNWTPVQYAIAC
ncbi:hypothetical protein [Kitasatospora viridis]|uniref:Peptidase inhibitor family I36 n=1 Tax=Kitasatospora viridis TaxID=281105 RepID=A0A561TT18_9ACTN|nr:hypothetical protein [Kitasatospora viridis]TWF90254.1 hypothetical protein FHX73_13298 [Kitasatospora viridis]